MARLLIICGPTATGKTALAIEIAQKYHGEIVSADSRQVYEGMDIGTGKDIPKNSKFQISNIKLNEKFNTCNIGFREKEGIPIWLVDVVEPDYQFNVGEYRNLARIVIQDIWNRGKLPIVVGGTGFYIHSIQSNAEFIDIPPDPKLREKT